MKKLTRTISKKSFTGGLASLLALVPAIGMAFVAPAAGDFGFAVYDFIMHTMLTGALGLMLAAICCGIGIYSCIDRQRGGVPVGVGFFVLAAAIYNIEDLATSIGFMV